MVYRGNIYMADLSPVVGSEQGGNRPVLVVQNDKGNKHSSTTIIIPLTSQDKALIPTHSFFSKKDNAYLSYDSVSLAEQIRVIDKGRIGDFIGTVSKEMMRELDKTLRISLDL